MSTRSPSAGPGVTPWIHTGGELQNNAVHGGWQLRSLLGVSQESSVRKSQGILGAGSIPALNFPPLSFRPSKTDQPIAVSHGPSRGDLVLGLPPTMFLVSQLHEASAAPKSNRDSFLLVCSDVCGFTFSFLLG